jgi:hypothetical protein
MLSVTASVRLAVDRSEMHESWKRTAIKTATENCTKTGANAADWNSDRDNSWWLLRSKVMVRNRRIFVRNSHQKCSTLGAKSSTHFEASDSPVDAPDRGCWHGKIAILYSIYLNIV